MSAASIKGVYEASFRAFLKFSNSRSATGRSPVSRILRFCFLLRFFCATCSPASFALGASDSEAEDSFADDEDEE